MININAQEIITIATHTAPNLNAFSIQDDGENLFVYDALIIRLLSSVFRLPYKIILPSDGEAGERLVDGNWTGKVGMAQRSEVDLAVGIPVSYTKFQTVKMSYPYIFFDITFATDKLKPDPSSFAVIHPFPLTLWILIIATIFIYSYLVFLHVYRKNTYPRVLFMLFGSLLEEAIGMKLQKISLKLVISIWLIFIFVIVNSYKAVLLSILTLPPLTGIRTISDLANAAEQKSVTCYSYKGTQKRLLESDIITWRSIGKCLQRNDISEDPEAAFLKAPSDKVLITARSFLTPYEEMYFISEDTFLNSMDSLSFSKKFSYQCFLDEMIHRLFAAGFFQKAEKDEQFLIKLNVTSYDTSDPDRLKILELADIKGAFVVLFSGYAVSTVVFIIEKVLKRYFPNSNVFLNIKRRKISKKMKN